MGEKNYTEKQLTEIVKLLGELDKIDGEIASTRVYFEEDLYKWGGIPDKGCTVEDSYGRFLREAKRFYAKSKKLSEPYKDVSVIQKRQKSIEKEFKQLKTLADKIYEINKKRKKR